MDQTTFDGRVFLTAIIVVGCGAVLLSTLASSGWRRLANAALIGAVTTIAAVLAYLGTGEGPAIDWSATTPGKVALGVALSALLGSVFAVVLSAAAIGIVKWNPGGKLPFKGDFRGVLAPHIGDRPGVRPIRPHSPPSRWRGAGSVTIAAGTGGIVGGLIGTGAFWAALEDSLSPGGIIAAALLTVISVALIGPFQDYVFEKRERLPGEENEPAATLADLFKGKASLRSWMRLGLVGLLLLALELVFNSIDNSIRAGDPALFTLLLLSGLTPAIVSYYWSAALQYAETSIARRTGIASTTAGSILYLGVGVMVTAGMAAGSTVRPMHATYFLVYVFLTVGIAVIMGFATCGVYAYLGGWMLDRFRGARRMIYLSAALALGAALQVVFVFLVAQLDERLSIDPRSIVSSLLIAVFWGFGLVASGFPKLVMLANDAPG